MMSVTHKRPQKTTFLLGVLTYNWQGNSQAVDGEDNVMPHDVKVPRDDRPFVRVVDDPLVDLAFPDCKQKRHYYINKHI